MNILHTETLKGWGGQQGKVLKELLAAKNIGETPYLICNPGSEIGKRAREHGIATTEIPINKKNFHRTVPFLLRFIKEQRIDVVISHGSTDSWVVALAGLFSDVKTVRERHNEFPINGFLSRLLHRKLFDRLLVVSDNVRDYLISIGVAEEKILGMPSSVDVGKFQNVTSRFREEWEIPQDAPVVGLFSSALRKEKGVFDFLAMIERVAPRRPLAYFILAGRYSETLRDRFAEKLREAGIAENRVIWTGFRSDIPNILHAFDIAVYPSHSEGMPNALLEQMACHLPAVVFDIPPMNVLVEEGETGFTVPFGDDEALAAKVLHLIDDASLRERMGEKAYRKVREHHDISSLDRRFRDLFDGLVHG